MGRAMSDVAEEKSECGKSVSPAAVFSVDIHASAAEGSMADSSCRSREAADCRAGGLVCRSDFELFHSSHFLVTLCYFIVGRRQSRYAR